MGRDGDPLYAGEDSMTILCYEFATLAWALVSSFRKTTVDGSAAALEDHVTENSLAAFACVIYTEISDIL